MVIKRSVKHMTIDVCYLFLKVLLLTLLKVYAVCGVFVFVFQFCRTFSIVISMLRSAF